MPTEPFAVEALQVPDTVAARLAGVSRATWWRLHAAAKTPAAVKLGRKRLWNRAELEAWIAAKCPDRQTWEAMQAPSRRYRVV
jgi:predicted DNA-binding transcriptional regulator AlpA